MPRPTMFPTLLRETFGSRRLPREPEPDLVMDDPEQVAAYVAAGRIDGVMAAAYLFHTARITQVIHGARKVLDLGCGPATQLAQVAAFNPGTQFLGVDLSEEMLSKAEEHVQGQGLSNVSFQVADITNLKSYEDQTFDGVISTMAFHQLPTHEHLTASFREIQRVFQPGGALYLTDFGRLKSLKSVLFFAYMNAAHQPHLFSLDYERSLRAAFLPEEFKRLVEAHLPFARVYQTFQIPLLVIIKSQDRNLPEELKRDLKNLRRGFSRRYRGELDDLRLFFRFGGLKGDPFG